LGVDTIVEGAVLRSGDRVRITAQLIRASSDKHLWAKSYQGNVQDVIALQDQIALDIAQQIRSTLAPSTLAIVAGGRTIKPDAYESYLQGEYLLNRWTRESIPKAANHFERAIAIDPEYVPAYTKLAGSYQILVNIGMMPQNIGSEKAKSLVARALQLDPQFPAAHAIRGWNLLLYDLDFSTAATEFKRALELNPNSVEGHEGLANYYATMGDSKESVLEMQRAREVDPLSLIVNFDLCNTLYLARRFDEALAQCNQTLALERRASILRLTGAVYAARGAYPQAAVAFREADEMRGIPPGLLVASQGVENTAAFRAYWVKVLQLRNSNIRDGKEDPLFVAQAYIRAGNDEEAVGWLEKAFQSRAFGITYLAVDPTFDQLHSDPRFLALLHRIDVPTTLTSGPKSTTPH
jgi:tetratricopeptide (TPR) repeat protein